MRNFVKHQHEYSKSSTATIASVRRCAVAVVVIGLISFAFTSRAKHKSDRLPGSAALPVGPRVVPPAAGAAVPQDVVTAAPPVVSLVHGVPSVRAAAARPDMVASYAQLPLFFEVNEGQVDPRVKFLSRGPGYSLFLEPDRATIVLQKRNSSHAAPSLGPAGLAQDVAKPTTLSPLELRLLGANPHAEMAGLEEQPGRSNIFVGSDPKRWRTNIAQYGQVRMAQVYQGIDLIYYGNRQQMEYDFDVTPGADPQQIRLSIAGAQSVRLAGNGDLQIATRAGALRLARPALYQIADGARKPVTGGFTMRPGGDIGFAVGPYDHTLPLVIDPVLVYSDVIDSGGSAQVTAVAVDASGDAYITGNTCGPDFPTTPGPFTVQHLPNSNVCSDVIVVKFNPSASSLVFSDLIGGSSFDSGTRLAVDSQDNVYVTGLSASTDFPTTANAILPSSSLPVKACSIFSYSANILCMDAFALKLSASGSSLVYSTFLGGSADTFGADVKVNANGNAFVLAVTNSSDIVPAPNGYQTTFGGGTCTVLQGTQTRPCFDGYLTELNAGGTAALYSTFLGGNDDDDAISEALDASGSVYIVGGANSANFPKTLVVPPSGSATPSKKVAYVLKLNPSATPASSGLVYAVQIQGDQEQAAGAIALDPNNNAYITGPTSSPHFPTLNPLQSTYGASASNTNCQNQGNTLMPAECGNAFVAGINSGGTGLLFSTFLGGTGPDFGTGIAYDSLANSLWVVGSTGSGNFPTTPNAYYTLGNGYQDGGFLTNLSLNGQTNLFSTLVSAGGGATQAVGVAVDGSSGVYVAGIDSDSQAFPQTPGVYAFNDATTPASFLVKYSPGAPPAIQYSPSTITFTGIPVGGAGAAQPITLQNTGTGPAQIAVQIGVTSDGNGDLLSQPDFVESDNCGTQLAPSAQCTIQVTFEPSPAPPPQFVNEQVSNLRSATLTILDNAPGGPHTVSLSGTTGNAAAFVVNQNPIAFAPQAPGTTSQPFNGSGEDNGDVPVTITNVAIGGADASDFTYIPPGFNACTQVMAGVFCSFQVTFHPAANESGTRTATLTFTDNAPDSPQVVNLSGTVDTVFNVSPASLTFGEEAIGATLGYTTGQLTIDNPTGSAAQITGLTLAGTNMADFSIRASTCASTTAPFAVPANSTCVEEIYFAPSAGSDGARTATLTVASPQLSSSVVVSLTGAAVTNSDPYLSSFVVPNPLAFGGVLLGQTTPTSNAILQISNPSPIPCANNASTCGGPLNITSMASGNGDFALTPEMGSGCTLAPLSISVGGFCNFYVTFTPSAAGNRNTVITIQSNDPRGAVTIPVSGTGLALPIVQVSPSLLSFGGAALNVAAPPQTVTLTNASQASLNAPTITAPANYAVASNGCTQAVAPGHSCSFTVTFTPPSLGNFPATLTIADNGAFGGQQIVALSGSGATGPSLSIVPSSVNFGNVVQGSTSPSQTITLASSGSAAVSFTNNGIYTTGDFKIHSNTCSSSLAPQTTCTVQVQFQPSVPFFENGSLLVSTNAPGSPQETFFEGNGTNAGSTASSTSLQASANSIAPGQPVTFTATVTSGQAGAGTPTGTVTFADGGTTIGSSMLNGSGVATFATSSLASGAHSISANYSGDANFAPSISNVLSVTVTGGSGTPSFSVSASPTSQTVPPGQSTSYSFTLTPSGGFNQAVAIACSGAPTTVTCTPASSSVTLNGTSASQVQMNLTTTAASNAVAVRVMWSPTSSARLVLGAFVLCLLVCSAFYKRRESRRYRYGMYILIVCLAVAIAAVGCSSSNGGGGGSQSGGSSPGGGGTGGTPAGTYTLTFSGTSGSTSHQTSVSLVVQ